MASVLVTTAVALATNYGVHVGSSWVYHEFCVPKDLWGVAQSIVTTASPVCAFLLSTMTITQNNYALIIGATITSAVAKGLTG
jgi:hypothetical protein